MARTILRPVEKPPALRIGAVVLAAGGSSRMRQPKQLMPIQGTPLILRTVNAVLVSPVWPVVVVLGSSADAVRPLLARLPLQLIDNPQWERGIGTSLRRGVEVLDQFSSSLDGVLVTLGDQPFLSPEAIVDLVSEMAGRNSIAAARYSGIVGAPAVFGRAYFSELLALPAGVGAQGLLRAHAKLVTPVDLPEFATDLDTPEDYQRFLEKTRSESRLKG